MSEARRHGKFPTSLDNLDKRINVDPLSENLALYGDPSPDKEHLFLEAFFETQSVQDSQMRFSTTNFAGAFIRRCRASYLVLASMRANLGAQLTVDPRVETKHVTREYAYNSAEEQRARSRAGSLLGAGMQHKLHFVFSELLTDL